MNWLPDMDLNHDKQIQSLLCYRYTIGQAGVCRRVCVSLAQSSRQKVAGVTSQVALPKLKIVNAL
jgi:hypothetical protein